MLSISRNVRLSVCPCVHVSVCQCVCSLLRYRLTVFLPPLLEVGCLILPYKTWPADQTCVEKGEQPECQTERCYRGYGRSFAETKTVKEIHKPIVT